MEHDKISRNPKLNSDCIYCIYCGEKLNNIELQGFSIVCPHCKKIQIIR